MDSFKVIITSGLVILSFGLLLLYFLNKKLKLFGVLRGKLVYQDTLIKPGEVLYAQSIPLCGKPDYIIREKEYLIPVEIKTGKTPTTPYLNHIMQLMSYCFIIEEYSGIRPPGGYIRYPNKEFKIAYTKEGEESVKTVVKDIMDAKKEGKEIHCDHNEHNLPQINL